VFFGQRQSGSNAGRRGRFRGGWRPNNRSSYRGHHGYGSAQNFSPTNSASGSQFGQQGNRVSYGSSQHFGQQSNWFGGSHRTIKCQLCYDYGHTAQQCSQLSTHHVQANANLAFNTAPTTSLVTWFPDTGANHHVTPDLVSMTSSEPYLGNDHLHVSDGKGLVIFNIAHSHIQSPKHTFTLSNILHVPTIKKPLLSVQKFCLENNVFFEFHPFVFYVKDLMTKEVLLSGRSRDGLYVLSESSATSLPQAFLST